MRIQTFLLSLFLLSVAFAQASEAASLRWPRQEGFPGYPWAKGGNDVLNARFKAAARIPQGTPEDNFSICDAIHEYAAQPSGTVAEIRWLAPKLVMARAGWYGSGNLGGSEYYYVLRRSGTKCKVTTYYMLWIA
jgi:hypothetical protein